MVVMGQVGRDEGMLNWWGCDGEQVLEGMLSWSRFVKKFRFFTRFRQISQFFFQNRNGT
jgi:hypothetical protein